MKGKWLLVVLAAGLMVMLQACSSGGGNPGGQVSISISPTSANLQPGGTQQFTATVTGTSNTAVGWKASGGNISKSGFYTAPSTAGDYTVTVTSIADPSTSAVANVHVLSSAQTSLSAPVAALPGSSNASLRAVSPLAESNANPGSTNQFVVPQQGAAVVGVMDTKRSFGWTAVWPDWFTASSSSVKGLHTLSSTAEIGPLSTAVELVFTVSGIFANTAETRAKTISTLRSLPEIHDLADALETNASASSPLDVPAVQTALLTAVTAAYQALGEGQPQIPSANTPQSNAGLTGQSLISFPYSLDQNHTIFKVDDSGRLTPAWADTSIIGKGANSLTWLGYVYDVDPQQFTSGSDILDHWANSDDAWRTDIKLKDPTPVGGMSLTPNTAWAYLDILPKLVDVAFNHLQEAVYPSGVQLQNNSIYAAHLYTCAFGLTTDRSGAKDNQLIANWDGGEASSARIKAFTGSTFTDSHNV